MEDQIMCTSSKSMNGERKKEKKKLRKQNRDKRKASSSCYRDQLSSDFVLFATHVVGLISPVETGVTKFCKEVVSYSLTRIILIFYELATDKLLSV